MRNDRRTTQSGYTTSGIWGPTDPETEAARDAFRTWYEEHRTGSREEVADFWRRVSAAASLVNPELARPSAKYPPPQPPAHAPVVYYLLFSDRVKIGTTTNLKKRLKAIAHDQVLATEPGGYDVEGERHKQFAKLHFGNEWFLFAEPLVSHIEALRGEQS